jgi:lysylphosphatidylglycerol synthetase-like protein (DUF2156 family)
LTITIPSLLGLAIADALNPFSIAALVYLLGTPRSLINGLIFTAGTYLTYLAGGLLLLAGWQSLVALVAPLLPWWSLGVLEALGGLALLIGGIWLWNSSRAGVTLTPPPDWSGTAVLIFAASSTIADLTSALPYFAAVNVLLLDPVLTMLTRVLAIALYCLVYCAPLLLMIGCQMLFRAQSAAIFQRIRGGVDWALAKLTAPLTTAGGVILLGDGIRRLWVGA